MNYLKGIYAVPIMLISYHDVKASIIAAKIAAKDL